MARITRIKRKIERFIDWQLKTCFRTIFISKRVVQIKWRRYILHFDRGSKDFFIAVRDGRETKSAITGYKTIYKGYKTT